MIAAILQVIGTVAAISALIWVRFAFVSLNRDLRVILAKQSEDIAAFDLVLRSIDRLEDRVQKLEAA